MNKTEVLNVRIDEELKTKAKAVAKVRGESVSTVVRRALEQYVKNGG